MGEGNLVIGVGKNKAETVMVSSTEIVGAAKSVTVGGGLQTTVGGVRNDSTAIGHYEEIGTAKSTVVGKTYEIVVGKSTVVLESDGTIKINGVDITIEAANHLVLKGKKIDLN
jgi:type VI secretion system secreted protein VgrG